MRQAIGTWPAATMLASLLWDLVLPWPAAAVHPSKHPVAANQAPACPGHNPRLLRRMRRIPAAWTPPVLFEPVCLRITRDQSHAGRNQSPRRRDPPRVGQVGR